MSVFFSSHKYIPILLRKALDTNSVVYLEGLIILFSYHSNGAIAIEIPSVSKQQN
jgi:hypothetical protein